MKCLEKRASDCYQDTIDKKILIPTPDVDNFELGATNSDRKYISNSNCRQTKHDRTTKNQDRVNSYPVFDSGR